MSASGTAMGLDMALLPASFLADHGDAQNICDTAVEIWTAPGRRSTIAVASGGLSHGDRRAGRRTGPMAQVMRGVRVLEVAQFIFAPSAGALLADWGADVIKVEHPVTADGPRGFVRWGGAGFDPDRNPLIEGCNRGKRSVGLDISTAEGRELLYELAKTADVFL